MNLSCNKFIDFLNKPPVSVKMKHVIKFDRMFQYAVFRQRLKCFFTTNALAVRILLYGERHEHGNRFITGIIRTIIVFDFIASGIRITIRDNLILFTHLKQS